MTATFADNKDVSTTSVDDKVVTTSSTGDNNDGSTAALNVEHVSITPVDDADIPDTLKRMVSIR